MVGLGWVGVVFRRAMDFLEWSGGTFCNTPRVAGLPIRTNERTSQAGYFSAYSPISPLLGK